MAEAFAKIHGKNIVNAFSAGSNPSGKINSEAVNAMKLLNYDLNSHFSKNVEEYRGMSFEYVITMGCGDACPFIESRFHEDWNIPDPKNLHGADFSAVRDLIEKKVMEILRKI